MPSALRAYANRRMALLLLLSISSGLPLLLTSKTLQAWLTEAKADLSVISWASLIGLPYTLKYLWAPLTDAIGIPPSRRRGWMLLAQGGVITALVAMAACDPGLSLVPLVVAAIAVAISSATQDIVVDAYRIEVLSEAEYGAGAGTYVMGYRIGMLTGSGLALVLADHLSWPQVYLVMAGIMLLGVGAALAAPEPRVPRAPASVQEAVVRPFVDWFTRQPVATALLILVFVGIYKLDDALVQNLGTPFLLQHGYTKTDIAALREGVGMLATISGALLGGLVVARLGIHRSLWILGAVQAVGVLAWWWLALRLAPLEGQPPEVISALAATHRWDLAVAVAVEHLGAGLGTAAFLAFLMSRCNPAFGATQFALLTSLMATGRTVLAGPAGQLMEALHLSWPQFFLLAAATGLPGLLLLPVVAPWTSRPFAGLKPDSTPAASDS
jgi:PAT family beta-lactamase induction signal transducer AmpG